MPLLYGCSNLVTVLSKVFLLHVSLIPISSILFSSLLQLLLTDRNRLNVPSTFCTCSHTGCRPTFHYLIGDILFRCFVSSTPASLS